MGLKKPNLNSRPVGFWVGTPLGVPGSPAGAKSLSNYLSFLLIFKIVVVVEPAPGCAQGPKALANHGLEHRTKVWTRPRERGAWLGTTFRFFLVLWITGRLFFFCPQVGPGKKKQPGGWWMVVGASVPAGRAGQPCRGGCGWPGRSRSGPPWRPRRWCWASNVCCCSGLSVA